MVAPAPGSAAFETEWRQCGCLCLERRAVLPVPNVAGSELAGAPVDDGQPGPSNEWVQLAIEYLIAKPDFAAPSGIVADIETSASAFIPKNGDRGSSPERVARELRSEGKGSDEEIRLAQWLIELGSARVARSEEKIVAPLAAVVSDVHKSDPRARRKIEGSDSRAVERSQRDRRMADRRSSRAR